MKYLIYVAIIFVLSSSVKAECSNEEAKVVRECYSKFQKVTNEGNEDHITGHKIGDDNKKYCEIFHEHQQCLKNGPKCFFDLTVKEMANMFEIDTEKANEMLLIDYGSKYLCITQKTLGRSIKDNKCIENITVADYGKECKQPIDCKDFKEFPACARKMLIKKCNNSENDTEIYADAFEYALINIMPKC